MGNFLQRHALWIALLVFMLLGLMLVLAPRVSAAPDPVWDKSTLSATGQCVVGGILRVTVTNAGEDMQGSVDYGWAVGITSGTLQLKAGESIVLDSPALPNTKIEFWVNQRPGHEGTGIAWVRMTCSPTLVALTTFNAAPITPDRHGIFGNTPLRADLQVFVTALALGLGALIVGKAILS